jgi:hypothetical protein
MDGINIHFIFYIFPGFAIDIDKINAYIKVINIKQRNYLNCYIFFCPIHFPIQIQ